MGWSVSACVKVVLCMGWLPIAVAATDTIRSIRWFREDGPIRRLGPKTAAAQTLIIRPFCRIVLINLIILYQNFKLSPNDCSMSLISSISLSRLICWLNCSTVSYCCYSFIFRSNCFSTRSTWLRMLRHASLRLKHWASNCSHLASESFTFASIFWISRTSFLFWSLAWLRSVLLLSSCFSNYVTFSCCFCENIQLSLAYFLSYD